MPLPSSFRCVNFVLTCLDWWRNYGRRDLFISSSLVLFLVTLEGYGDGEVDKQEEEQTYCQIHSCVWNANNM